LVKGTNSWSEGDGIQGFGISNKIVENKWTNLHALVIYVDEKKNRLPKRLRIPEEISISKYGKIITDVVEIGQIGLCNANQQRRRPAFMGCSVGHSTKTTGSIGSVFQKHKANILLSCGHVLAPVGAHLGDSICQPGYLDSSDSMSMDIVATLSYFSELGAGLNYPNLADVGLAHESVPSALLQDDGDISDYTFARIRLPVHFFGRSTEHSFGEVIGIHYRDRFNIRGSYVGFQRQIITTCPSSKGDSGALLRTSSNRPVGLLLGGSIKGSVFSPMSEVIRQIDVSFESYGTTRRSS